MSKRVERINAPAETHIVGPSTPSPAQTLSSHTCKLALIQTLPDSSADKLPEAPLPVTRDAAAPSWTSGGSEVRVWTNPSSPSLQIPGEFLPAVCSQTEGGGLHGARSGVTCMGVGCGHRGSSPQFQAWGVLSSCPGEPSSTQPPLQLA